MQKELAFLGVNTHWCRLDQGGLKDIFVSRYLQNLQVLRVQLDFETTSELEEILEALSGFLQSISPKVCLLQVKYKPSTLCEQARYLHQSFMDRHSQVSSYIPLCVPPSPLAEQVIWASPQTCTQCIFLEGQRCGGLTGQEALDNPLLQAGVKAGGALAKDWQAPLNIELFRNTPPVCYWWPEPRLTAILDPILKQHDCQTVWDVGGGNGFVAWWLKQSFTSVQRSFCIDPIAFLYEAQNGVEYYSIKSGHALELAKSGDLVSPDLIVISWPSTGLLFHDLIHELKPKVILRITDGEGVCGVRRGHRALLLSGVRAEVFGLDQAFTSLDHELDELEPPKGYALTHSNTVWCYRDFQSNADQPSGVLRVFERLDKD